MNNNKIWVKGIKKDNNLLIDTKDSEVLKCLLLILKNNLELNNKKSNKLFLSFIYNYNQEEILKNLKKDLSNDFLEDSLQEYLLLDDKKNNKIDYINMFINKDRKKLVVDYEELIYLLQEEKERKISLKEFNNVFKIDPYNKLTCIIMI